MLKVVGVPFKQCVMLLFIIFKIVAERPEKNGGGSWWGGGGGGGGGALRRDWDQAGVPLISPYPILNIHQNFPVPCLTERCPGQ